MSAYVALVMKFFVPFSTQSLPSFTAVVRRPPASLPDPARSDPTLDPLAGGELRQPLLLLFASGLVNVSAAERLAAATLGPKPLSTTASSITFT